MYNRYINSEDFFKAAPQSNNPGFEVPHCADTEFENVKNADGYSESASPEQGKPGRSLFGFKLPDFDADTILMLVLVYFLISDELTPSSNEDGEKGKKNISDTLLIIGALLLLGF